MLPAISGLIEAGFWIAGTVLRFPDARMWALGSAAKRADLPGVSRTS
jgi:hypothetical protein